MGEGGGEESLLNRSSLFILGTLTLDRQPSDATFFLLVWRKKLKEERVIGSLFFVVGPGGVDQLSDFEFSFSFLY
jgi:hypothetical protein